MATTPNLSLRKPILTDTFSLANDLNANWDIIDALFGVISVDIGNNRVGIGTSTPDSLLHIKGNIPGTVGSSPAGQLIIQNPTDSVFSNVVITAYESDGAGNPDQQLWYLGSSSGSNSDIILLNRRNSKLQLGTNGVAKMTISGDGKIGIGLIPTANMEGLSIEAGLLTLKETTTPTADTNYAKIYSKDTNKLFFQDGAGVEHEIAFV